MKKFLVTLNSSKCMSYTFGNGRKHLPNRPIAISEADVEMYEKAGVFIINPIEASPQKAIAKAQPTKNKRSERNLEDRGEIVEETSHGLDKREEELSGRMSKPKGVITSDILKK